MYRYKIIRNFTCIFESSPTYQSSEDAEIAGNKKAKYLYDNRHNPEICGGLKFENETLDDFAVLVLKE